MGLGTVRSDRNPKSTTGVQIENGFGRFEQPENGRRIVGVESRRGHFVRKQIIYNGDDTRINYFLVRVGEGKSSVVNAVARGAKRTEKKSNFFYSVFR